jgi:hypothetical protein
MSVAPRCRCPRPAQGEAELSRRALMEGGVGCHPGSNTWAIGETQSIINQFGSDTSYHQARVAITKNGQCYHHVTCPILFCNAGHQRDRAFHSAVVIVRAARMRASNLSCRDRARRSCTHCGNMFETLFGQQPTIRLPSPAQEQAAMMYGSRRSGDVTGDGAAEQDPILLPALASIAAIRPSSNDQEFAGAPPGEAIHLLPAPPALSAMPPAYEEAKAPEEALAPALVEVQPTRANRLVVVLSRYHAYDRCDGAATMMYGSHSLSLYTWRPARALG